MIDSVNVTHVLMLLCILIIAVFMNVTHMLIALSVNVTYMLILLCILIIALSDKNRNSHLLNSHN